MSNMKFDVKRFCLKKLNVAEVKEQYQVKSQADFHGW
jgi:hypothetical protein